MGGVSAQSALFFHIAYIFDIFPRAAILLKAALKGIISLSAVLSIKAALGDMIPLRAALTPKAGRAFVAVPGGGPNASSCVY